MSATCGDASSRFCAYRPRARRRLTANNFRDVRGYDGVTDAPEAEGAKNVATKVDVQLFRAAFPADCCGFADPPRSSPGYNRYVCGSHMDFCNYYSFDPYRGFKDHRREIESSTEK